MAYKKGEIGNPNGRPKGSTNKHNAKLRGMITQFVEDKMEDVIKSFDKLKPGDKVAAFTALLKYALPPARDEVSDKSDREAVASLVERLFFRDKREEE